MESMSSSLLLMEPMGGLFEEFLLACRTAWCGRVFRTTGVTRGSGCVPRLWVLAVLFSLAPVGVALHASRPTTRVFCHVVSLMRDE